MTIRPSRALSGRVGMALAVTALGAAASGQAAHASTTPPPDRPVVAYTTIGDRPLATFKKTKRLVIRDSAARARAEAAEAARRAEQARERRRQAQEAIQRYLDLIRAQNCAAQGGVGC